MMDKLSLKFIERHPDDAARTVERYTEQDKTLIMSSLSAASAAKLLQSMTPVDAGDCLALVNINQAIAILQEMPANLAAVCIRGLPGKLRNQILKQAKIDKVLKKVIQLLRFPPYVAGSIMDPAALSLQTDMTVKQVIAFIKRHADKLQDKIYTVDTARVLAGYILTRDLLLSASSSSINILIRPCEYTLAAHASLEMAKDSPGWLQADRLPVVDNHNVYLGVLTRATLENSLQELNKQNISNEQSMDILLGLAETFVNTCSEILSPDKK